MTKPRELRAQTVGSATREVRRRFPQGASLFGWNDQGELIYLALLYPDRKRCKFPEDAPSTKAVYFWAWPIPRSR